jgi:beta-lactamase class D
MARSFPRSRTGRRTGRSGRRWRLRSFERSTAWYFQSLVPHVGASNYQRWLDRFGYGNRVVPPDGDDFWLDGSLRVSVREQVEFLACLATTGCGTSRHSVQLLERLAQQDSAGPRRLYGKTGSGPLRRGDFDGPFGGWFVGYVRGANAQAPVVFALYAEGESFSSLRSFRRQMAMRLLTQIQAWPS